MVTVYQMVAVGSDGSDRDLSSDLYSDLTQEIIDQMAAVERDLVLIVGQNDPALVQLGRPDSSEHHRQQRRLGFGAEIRAVFFFEEHGVLYSDLKGRSRRNCGAA